MFICMKYTVCKIGSYTKLEPFCLDIMGYTTITVNCLSKVVDYNIIYSMGQYHEKISYMTNCCHKK